MSRREFISVWILYPHKGYSKTILSYDLKKARKEMLKYVMSQFHHSLGQDRFKKRKGYFRQVGQYK
jgi:hypothetical protein